MNTDDMNDIVLRGLAREDQREWIARLIRTNRLKESGAGKVLVMFSPDAPAEPSDIETAEAILTYLNL